MWYMIEFLHCFSDSADATRRIGERLGELCVGGEVLLLSGDLGAGKTCFVQGLARGLGIPEEWPVTSPTFVLHNQYQGRLRLDHIDFYRLMETGSDKNSLSRKILDGLGLDDIWGASDGVCAVEWPEVFDLQGDTNSIRIRFYSEDDSPSHRKIEFRTAAESHEKIIQKLLSLITQ